MTSAYRPGLPNITLAGKEWSFANACTSLSRANNTCDWWKKQGCEAFWRKGTLSSGVDVYRVYVHPPQAKFYEKYPQILEVAKDADVEL